MNKRITAYMGHKLLALVLCGLLILAALPLSALAAEETAQNVPQYVLMNIPYADFYQAEVSNNDVPVDAVTSATLNKPRTGSLVGGSYHVSSEGTDISGVTFPVKVDGVDLSGFRQITDSDSVDITVTNRGQTSTTTYTGSEALFEAESYAYYVLEDVPTYYKELTFTDGNLTFGAIQGTEPKTISGTAALSTHSNYGDYQIDVDLGEIELGTVYGVTLTTTEGSNYGLRHLENIWQKTKLAFCTGFTENVHGSPTSAAHYTGIMGQTISKITYYTSDGIYEISVELPVPVKSYETVTATVDGQEKQVQLIKTEGEGTGFSTLDLTDTEVFANGADDAYLVTIGEETQLVGDKTLAKWVGSWESWERYIDGDPDYPYLDQVWQLAYDAYMATFQAAGIDMSATMPNADALKAYWKNLATTKGVDKMEIAGNARAGYTIQWLGDDGQEIYSSTYAMTGKLLKGFEGAAAYVFTDQAGDASGDYKYFVAMEAGIEGTEEEPIAGHYHFQFGSDLGEMLLKGELYNSSDYGTNETTGRPISSNLKNAQWYATMIDADASDLAKYNVILGMHRADKWSGLPEPVVNVPFTDVQTGDYYYAPVAWAFDEGITSGTSATTFSPGTSCTRAQMVTMLWRAAGSPEASSNSRFTDVPANAYYSKAVAWAAEKDITSGTGKTTFSPNATVTRAQVVTFLYRYAGASTAEGSSFKDIPTGAYYAKAVQWAAANGVAAGTGNGLFSPDAPCTRAQAVTFMYRCMGE